ncbi:MAG: Rpp14/Pop5 family protein [Promethearchaeota archaeon]
MTKKERQRYIKFRIFSEKPLNIESKEIAKAIWRNFNFLFGEIKSGKAGFWIMEYDVHDQEGIIRCSNAVLYDLIATLTLITELNSIKVSIDTVKTSGLISRVKKV